MWGVGLQATHAHTHPTTPTPPPLLRRRDVQPRPSSLRRSRDHGRSSRETDQDQDRRGEAVRSARGAAACARSFLLTAREVRRNVGPRPGSAFRASAGGTRGAAQVWAGSGWEPPSLLARPPSVRGSGRPRRWLGGTLCGPRSLSRLPRAGGRRVASGWTALACARRAAAR